MKTKLHANGHHNATSVRVLIAYDTVCSGKRAKELCDRLQTRLGSEYQLNLRLWSLAALQRDSLAHAAMSDAASADLIFVSFEGNKPLSPTVRSRLGRCASKIQAGGAIILQLHGILKMEEELTCHFLKQVASDAGLDFFPEVIGPVDDEADYSLESIHKRARMPSPMLDALLQPH